MTTPTQTANLSPIEVLAQIVLTLDHAAAEADAELQTGFTLESGFLASEAALMRSEAMDLLPGQCFPDVERPRADGTDPFTLLHQAEELTHTMAIEEFPTGMAHFVARLIDTITDLS